jgi:hypothetical protein
MASKAILENCRCQGDTANSKAARSPPHRPRREAPSRPTAMTVAVPKRAAVTRTPKTLEPSSAVTGTQA